LVSHPVPFVENSGVTRWMLCNHERWTR